MSILCKEESERQFTKCQYLFMTSCFLILDFQHSQESLPWLYCLKKESNIGFCSSLCALILNFSFSKCVGMDILVPVWFL